MQKDEVIKDDRRKRFFIALEGKEAHLKYRMKDENTIEYFSTFVPEEYRGKPYARELVECGLNYARENHLKVIATCPYVKKFISKNEEEYKDLTIESSSCLNP